MRGIGPREQWAASRALRAAGLAAGLVLLYCIYVFGIWQNPPGFYVDESALSYNGYLISQTGVSESGDRFPLFFKVYTGGFTQYANPTHVYLLAALFKVFPPGVITARLFAAFWVFLACILLGFLARRISGSVTIGAAVGGMALVTPWLFQVSRLVLETFFYPLAIVLLLWSVYRVSAKERWSMGDALAIAASLTLVTYSYTIGRLLGPLLAAGLMLFATGRARVLSVIKVWLLFAIAMIPLAAYMRSNPGLSQRFYSVSYIKRDSGYVEIVPAFLSRLIEDLNPLTLLLRGDANPRHHLPEAWGSFYLAVFALSILGLAVIIRRHRRDRWWLYVVFGTIAAAVPGALTNDKFHTLRMLAYPVFLLVLTIPALRYLLERHGEGEVNGSREGSGYWHTLRGTALTGLIILGTVEAVNFHVSHYIFGPDRGYVFDAEYKSLYDAAMSQPIRPIYLVDGYWGPMYVHAYWYAVTQGRSTKEFIHLPYAQRPPAGAIVLSSERECTACEIFGSEGNFLLYRAK